MIDQQRAEALGSAVEALLDRHRGSAEDQDGIGPAHRDAESAVHALRACPTDARIRDLVDASETLIGTLDDLSLSTSRQWQAAAETLDAATGGDGAHRGT